MDYYKTAVISKEVGEHNDCAVKAVAIACDVSYRVAQRALQLQGRQKGSGTYRAQTYAAIQLLGFKFESVQINASTVASLPRDRAVSQGYYLVHVRAHVLAVVNGTVQDWTDGRRHRIKDAKRIVPVATRKERRAMINKMMVL